MFPIFALYDLNYIGDKNSEYETWETMHWLDHFAFILLKTKIKKKWKTLVKKKKVTRSV